ncbi:AMP-dependent synthetase/ligase [Mycolicibacterium hodleri]|uniref:Long-chain fatty acid--CoA ligase n=1 Tax=Mycolicibacterium hodleri TaxID=49897 RepID=A0A502E3W5_9MYCO|nr:long-chain fatty acid--CoA ligase [Mycolicibacterium hodleri]TPG32395.1 long-chain fatty acid--CoA ligase [Mycolicibacterium hodleri]
MAQVVDALDLMGAPPVSSPTVAEAFQRVVAQHPDQTALRTLGGAVSFTWRRLNTEIAAVAAGLAGLGIEHGDTVAQVLPNVPECHIVDYAALHIGAVPFTIFNSSSAEQIEHQLRNADAKIVFTKTEFLPKVRKAVAGLGSQVQHVIVIDGDADTTTMKAVYAAASPDFDFEARWRSVKADDLATLIYTSGTTGPPKGAQWTHNTVMAQQRALAAALPMPTDGIIAFLPMAHAGGRIIAHYMALLHGATLTTCEDMKQVPVYLAEVHPDAFFSVPRLWEKLQVAIEGMVEAIPDDDERAAAKHAIEIGLRKVKADDAGGTALSADDAASLATEHAQGLTLLRPILATLGLDKIKAAFVGGAPSTPELAQFFRAVGVPLLEAYGLTEASLNIFNRLDDFKCGTAGKPLPGVEVKLADDGELMIRSELVMAGYRKQPEETAAALDADGWLHTGDIAEIDDQGFVAIVDRKKEIIISSSGKNMSPVNIESAIRGESSLIGQVLAIGDRKPYVVALVALDPEAASVYAKRLRISGQSLEELSQAPELREVIQEAVDRGNKRLNRSEQIKKFVVLPTAWLPDSDEMTPTAKLKRKPIQSKYAAEIADLYA